MKQVWQAIGWGYAIEIICTGLLYVLTTMLVDTTTFFQRFANFATQLMVLVGIFLAASFGAFWAYFSQSSSEFGRWLHWRKASRQYALSFACPIFIHLAALIIFALMTTINTEVLSRVAFGLGIYSLLNVASQISNGVSYMRLRDVFAEEWRQKSEGGGTN